MPIETPAGTLEVENAKFRASSVEATIAVGIGTESNDAYPLQVFKETSPDIRLSEGSTISSAARFYSNNSNLYIQTGTNFTSGSSGDIAFQTMVGQSTHMVIKSDGNVGIGTASPRGMLDIYTGATSTAGLIIDRYASGTYRSELYQESNGLAIKVGDGSNAPTENMRITSSDVMIPGRLALGTSTASSSQLYISAPGNGTSTSTGDFHVNNSAGMTLYGTRPWITTTNGQGHTGKLCSINFYASGHQPAIEWTRDVGQGTNQRNWLLRQETDDALYTWHYNGSAWSVPMYVKSDAVISQVNVGIGTASPNAVLDIEGLKTRFNYEYRYQDYWTSNNNQTLTIPVSGGSARGLMFVEAKVVQVAANSSSNRVARVKGMISNYHTGNYYMTVIEGENVSAFETYMVGTSGSAAGTFTMKYRPQEGYQQSVVCRLYLKIFIGGFTSSLGSLTRTDAGSNSALTAPSWDVAKTSFGGNVGINTTDPQATLHVNGYKFIATGRTCYVSGQVTKDNGNTGAQTKNYFAVDIGNGYNQFQIELRGYCRNSQGNGNVAPFKRFYTIGRNLSGSAVIHHTSSEDINASGWTFTHGTTGGSTSTQTIYFTVVMPNKADGATYLTLTATVLAQNGGTAHSARIP